MSAYLPKKFRPEALPGTLSHVFDRNCFPAAKQANGAHGAAPGCLGTFEEGILIMVGGWSLLIKKQMERFAQNPYRSDVQGTRRISVPTRRKDPAVGDTAAIFPSSREHKSNVRHNRPRFPDSRQMVREHGFS